MKLILSLLAIALCACAADKPSAITDKDRAEAFKLQRDIATVQAQFQAMRTQYESAVKQMQEQATAADKQFAELKTRLQKVCEGQGKVLNEADIACADKPSAAPAKK